MPQRSCTENPEKHPFDLTVKRLLVILSRPQWTRIWREQRDTESENYSFKMFGSEKRKRNTSVVGRLEDAKLKTFI